MKRIELGVSGDVGSFSEEAGLLYAKKTDIAVNLTYLIDMETVLSAIENKKVDVGILPVVNTQGGLVKMAFQAMGNHRFTVIDDISLNIQQCLLTRPNTKSHQIRRIVSHSQAISQCEQFLKKEFKNVETVEWIDTAKAARDLASGNLDKETAVIASEHAASLYGLNIMHKNIQDHHSNMTIFIIVQR